MERNVAQAATARAEAATKAEAKPADKMEKPAEKKQ